MTCFDPVQMLFVVFDAVNAVEGERAEQRVSGDGAPHAGDSRGVLVAQQMPAEAGFGALRIFEFHDPHALDGILAHAEKAGGDLRDHVVVIRLEPVRIPSLARAGKAVPGRSRASFGQNSVDAHRPETHSSAVYRDVDVYLRPAIIATIQIQAGVDLSRSRLLQALSSFRSFGSGPVRRSPESQT